eukprot:Mycagemm_TRINITY_DN10333_c0_g4::TRINITY_DN10333_c0_g4_i1::g.1353::m.1353 type:complete len:117 gc:universal TRINITY_DN10333_c0_g4_i1:615-265(-)
MLTLEVPSPTSTTQASVRPDAYTASTPEACERNAGTLKLSNIICVAFSLLAFPLRMYSYQNNVINESRRNLVLLLAYREKHRVLFGGRAQLVVEGMMPNLLHVVPVRNDTVFHGIL